MRTRLIVLTLVLMGLLALGAPAFAQDACQSVAGNLVANCGFETGDFTGWTLSGNTGFTGLTGAPYNNSGSFGAFLGPVGSDGFLTQIINGNTLSFQYRQDPGFWGLDTVSLTAVVPCGANCTIYSLDFFLSNTGGTPNDFTILWNGVDLGQSIINKKKFRYTDFSGILEGSSSAVPEPGSMVLLGSGLFGLAGLVRRKLSL